MSGTLRRGGPAGPPLFYTRRPRQWDAYLEEAPAAAAGRGVLRGKDRVPAPGRLPAVVRDDGGRQPRADERLGVTANFKKPPTADEREVGSGQMETGAEGRAREALEEPRGADVFRHL